jgi:phosphoglycerate dehydrogenase-like enzyme
VPDRVPVLIASPLEPELAERIAAADPRVELLFDPELLPAARWPGDHAGDGSFRRDRVAEARWQALLDRAVVAFGISGGDTPDGLVELLRKAPRLRWVHATSAGAGELVRRAGLDPETLARVRITTSSGVHATPLAEFALLGLLAFAKELPRLAADQRARAWPTQRHPVRELRGQTLFVVGVGAIGEEVARLGGALGMRVVGFRRDPSQPSRWTDELHGPDRLRDLVDRADALVVTLPLTGETAGLVDAETIARMRPGCVFVNVGRGGVVDEEALIDALRDGRLAGAALDVFATEPLPPGSPLWTLPNVLVSPHGAALSARENERIVDLFVDNLRGFLDGARMANVVEPGVFY